VKASVWRATSWEMKIFECMDGKEPICYLSGEGKRERDRDSITRR
jgi:hypothetical protein